MPKMSTRRNSGVSEKKSRVTEPVDSVTPVRRSGRQVKRKLTKTESSELGEITSPRAELHKGKVSTQTSNETLKPAKQRCQNGNPVTEKTVTRSAKSSSATKAEPSTAKRTPADTKKSVRLSVIAKSPLQPKTEPEEVVSATCNRTTPRGKPSTPKVAVEQTEHAQKDSPRAVFTTSASQTKIFVTPRVSITLDTRVKAISAVSDGQQTGRPVDAGSGVAVRVSPRKLLHRKEDQGLTGALQSGVEKPVVAAENPVKSPQPPIPVMSPQLMTTKLPPAQGVPVKFLKTSGKSNPAKFPQTSSKSGSESSQTLAKCSPVKSPQISSQDSRVKSPQTSSQDSPVKSTQTSGKDSPVNSTQTSGQDSPVKSSQTSSQGSPVKSPQTSSPVKSTQTSGQDSPVKSSQTSSQGSPVKSPQISSQDSRVKSPQTSSQDSCVKPTQTSGKDSPVKSTEKKSVELSEGISVTPTQMAQESPTKATQISVQESSPKSPRMSSRIQALKGANSPGVSKSTYGNIAEHIVVVSETNHELPVETAEVLTITDDPFFREPDQKEADPKGARPRRKRVASELLQAAEIAHGLLDTPHVRSPEKKSRDAVVSSPRKVPAVSVTEESCAGMRSLLPPKGSKTPEPQTKGGQEIKAHSSTTTSSAITLGDPDKSDSLKKRVVSEKNEDSVFESVTAIVKSSYISTPEEKEFVLQHLPIVTGASAVVSPSNHYLLHGSWLSIIRARRLLERHLRSLEGGKKEDNKQPLSDFAMDDDSSVEENDSESPILFDPEQTMDIDTGDQSNPDGVVVVMSRDDPNSVALNVMVETENSVGTNTSEDLLDGDSLLSLQADGSKGLGKIEGLDRSKLTGNVEMYKDPAKGSLFLCSMCGFASQEQRSVEAHINRKHWEKEFRCKFCPKAFAYKRELERHMNIVHVQEAKFTCELCMKQFTDKRYLATHRKRHAGVRNHQCPLCGRKFFERHKLKWHLETHKSAEEKQLPYSCSICSKQFYNRSSLSDHQNIHTGARPFECDLCEASFSHRIGLKRHLLVHNADNKFSCEECGKTFKTSKQFEAHKVQHTGVGKHMCERCFRVFATQFSLKRHMVSCDRKAGKQEDGWGACTVENVEEVVVSPDPTPPPPGLPADNDTVFMCGVCDRLFSSLEETAAHTRTHTAGEAELNAHTVQSQAGVTENYTITLQDPTSVSGNGQESYVYVSGDGVTTGEESAVKLFNAMTAAQEYVIQEGTCHMDDTQIVANTLADLSALGQGQN